MAVIGSLAVTAWRGDIQGERRSVEPVTRAGVDGLGLLVGAYQSTISEIETDYVDTLVNVETWESSADALVGDAVSVTDGWGNVWTDVAILSVTYRRTAIKYGGATRYLTRATWQMAADY